jgi:hypothetical protein
MKIIKLPYKTSYTKSGPIIKMKDANVSIRYDYEDDRGQILWTEIIFGIVYGYKYTEIEYIDTLEYEFGLVQIEDSKWKKQMHDIWVKERGNDPERVFGGEAEKVHHYRLFFDNDGIHEIICKAIRIHVEN